MSKIDKIRALKKLIITNAINKEESLKQLENLIINSNLNTDKIEELDAFKINIEKNMTENKELKRLLALSDTEIKKLKDSGHYLLN